ncbi:MAG: NUDIX domain-containing protein [Alphaproteobacteria bacterium]|nr:MAG: NUDIX domain-containing protein [Alphaproteobacteria bacterium]
MTVAFEDVRENPPAGVAPARPAASVLVVRDGGEGLEVLVVLRSRAMRFAGGMLVFPGGRVDAADAGARLACRQHPRRALKIAERAFRFAAIREAFEEAGLLLGARHGNARAVGEALRRRIERRHRARLLSGGLSFVTLAEREGLRFDLGTLVPFAHWVTPWESPKRFDTRFYLAPAPAGQRAGLIDAIENTHLSWRRPTEILEAWQAGEQPLMFPTRLNLMKLARARTVEEALAFARRTPIHCVRPEIVGPKGEGRRLVIPESAGFGVCEARSDELDPVEGYFVAEAPLAAS